LTSTAMIEIGFTWHSVYGTYLAVAVVATFLMGFVNNYHPKDDQTEDSSSSSFDKVFAAVQLLWKDPKMKYMSGTSIAFGFSATFSASYVGGTVEPIALSDEKSAYIGVLSATTSAVAAIFSLIFGYLAQKSRIGKGPILMIGAVFFFVVGFSFVAVPNPLQWNFISILMIYIFQGIGRATFESTLRASFVDMFPMEKEGAFANIILQNGLSSVIGYFIFPIISPLAFEWIVMTTSILAIGGFLIAFDIQKNEAERVIESEESVL